jgi:O-antigen/teichoic acid export membrane protein
MSGRAVAFAVTFFVPAVLARVFSQTEFGTYKQWYLVVYTLFGLGQLGLAECLFYFLPLKPHAAGRYAFNSLVMLGTMGLCFSTGLLLNSSRVTVLLNNPGLEAYIPLAGLYLMFMLMGTVLEITMISRKSFRLATVTYVISDILRAASLVVPALLLRSLQWTLICGVAFCVLRVCGILIYFRSEFGPGLKFDMRLFREQLAYALPFFLSVIVQIIQQNYHQYAVSFHFDAAAFAIYSVGCLQIPLVDFMATPASNVMMVQMGEDIREGRACRLLEIWHDTTRKLAFVFFPLVGLLVVNAFHLITLLFGKAYIASVPIFTVWSLSILFAAFQTDGVLRVFAQNRCLLIINITRLAVIALSMGWFLSAFHLMGAVLVTLIGMLIAKVMALVRIKSLLHARLDNLFTWKTLGGSLMAAMLAAIPALIVNAKLDLPSLVILPISGMAYVIAYGALVLGFGLLSEGERRVLWSPAVALYERFRA